MKHKKPQSIKKYFVSNMEIFFLVFICFFSLFSYFSEKSSTNEYKKIISQEISSQINTQLQMFFVEAPRVLKINSEFVKIGKLDLTNQEQVAQIFTTQIKNYPYLTYISYGNIKGEYVGVNRSIVDEKINFITALENEDMRLNTYETTQTNTKGKLLEQGNIYNAIIRPWYVNAIKNQKDSWYSAYKHANNDSMGIGISTPIYDEAGNIQGVFSADQSLVMISQFLKTLNLQKNGLAFIAEHNGSLIATSLDSQVYDMIDNQFKRFTLGDYPDIRLNEINSIFNTFKNFESSKTIDIDGEEYLYNQFLFQDEYGLSIVVGILLAHKDFSSGFEQNIIIWGLFIGLFAVFGFVLLNNLSKKLAQPIEKLNQYTSTIAQGNFENDIKNNTNINEINELTASFNTMRQKLKESFYLLIAQSSFVNVGKTLSSISHQYKTPLSHINSQVLELEIHLYKTETQDIFLKNITNNLRKSVSFMDDTMVNFNNFYKYSDQKESFDIAKEIEFVCDMLSDRIKNINLTIDIIGSDFTYNGYKNAFDNVIMIIIENAIDIFESNKTKNPYIGIFIENNTEYITIKIEDNAGGIKINPIENIFNTFASTKSKSSGLGLPMCKMLVDTQLNGSIIAYNLDNGACFAISIS